MRFAPASALVLFLAVPLWADSKADPKPEAKTE